MPIKHIVINASLLITVGMIVLAKRQGLIPSVIEPIQALQNASLWLSENLIQMLKQQAGE